MKPPAGTMLYILDDAGAPVRATNVIEWSAWMGTTDERRIARDELGDVTVSTVFLGLDHGWGRGDPVLWETEVFGGAFNRRRDRYTSRAAALLGHAEWVALCASMAAAPDG